MELLEEFWCGVYSPGWEPSCFVGGGCQVTKIQHMPMTEFYEKLLLNQPFDPEKSIKNTLGISRCVPSSSHFPNESLTGKTVFTLVNKFVGSPHPWFGMSYGFHKGWWIPPRAQQQWFVSLLFLSVCPCLVTVSVNRDTWVQTSLVGAQDAGSRGETQSPASRSSLPLPISPTPNPG